MIKSKLLIILIGNDLTGKTTLQKLLVHKLCHYKYKTLHANKDLIIENPEINRKYVNVSFGSRSYQEKKGQYKSVERYFANHFKPADISIISSHLVVDDIKQMIICGKQRFYNVIGVFWSNSIKVSPELNSDVAALNWNEILHLSNPIRKNKEQIGLQLDLIAESMLNFLINRTSI